MIDLNIRELGLIEETMKRTIITDEQFWLNLGKPIPEECQIMIRQRKALVEKLEAGWAKNHWRD